MLAATYAMVGRICPLGRDRVKVSENLGATAVAPVAPVVTSLPCREVPRRFQDGTGQDLETLKTKIKNPLFYGFLALFLLETVEAMVVSCYFQPNPRVISQISASHECTVWQYMLWSFQMGIQN